MKGHDITRSGGVFINFAVIWILILDERGVDGCMRLEIDKC